MTGYTGISPAAPFIMDKGAAFAVTASSWVYQAVPAFWGCRMGGVLSVFCKVSTHC